MKYTLKISNMPVFWRETKSQMPVDGIPSRLDATLMGPEAWGGISLEVTNKLKRTLEKIYREDENIGYLQDNNPLADVYAPEYLNFVAQHTSPGAHICEIGAGGCYSLIKLKQLGYKVSAIDPSPVTLTAGHKYHITVVSDFFPPIVSQCPKNVDVFIHYDVLEHVEDPTAFLHSIYAALSDGGKTLFVVPDSTLHIKEADLSMCLHQHLNYFSEKSLRNIVYLSGFRVDDLYRSKSTGTLYCAAVKDTRFELSPAALREISEESMAEARDFFINAPMTYDATTSALNSIFMERSGQMIGIYPPLRAIPYLSPLIEKFKNQLVFIDDNPKVHSRYICDLDFPIMSRKDAIDSGVRCFLICSKPFRSAMDQKLKDQLLGEKYEILFLSDLPRLGISYDN